MKPKPKKPEPPRPPCGTCGEPAEHELSIEVQGLKLEKEGCGPRQWRSDWRSGTSIRTLLCGKCVRSHVTLRVQASANVDKVAAVHPSKAGS